MFLQVRRLQESLRQAQEQKEQSEEGGDSGSQEYLEALIRGVRLVERKVDDVLAMTPEQVLPELGEIKRRLGDMDRSAQHHQAQQPTPQSQMNMNISSMSHQDRGGRSADSSSGKGDAYREARLLLANGVDEERVINETGLTVEEVSLLKRITFQDAPQED
ncbi:MAG: hypothetical protein HQL53_12840 [Magnetococcales bacterium]|nr:hypothetical protein [Magnetococcales bacterium]